MAKTSNNTPVSKKSTKKQGKALETSFAKTSWLTEYIDATLQRSTPLSEQIVDKLADELTEWVKKEDKLTLRSFLIHKKIPWDTFYVWIDKYPKLKVAHQLAMMNLSERREIGGMTRKFDTGFTLNSMPMYDPMWKEFVQWKASLKDPSSENKNITLVLPDITSKCSCKEVHKEE